MKCLAVIDTNILVSALISPHPNSATVQVVSKMILGEVTPVYCKEILAEYREVLGRTKFHFPKDTVDQMLAVIEKYGLYVASVQTQASLSDEKDLPFFNAAWKKRKDGAYLVTGNLKHFPTEPFIVTARQFLEVIEKSESRKTAAP